MAFLNKADCDTMLTSTEYLVLVKKRQTKWQT